VIQAGEGPRSGVCGTESLRARHQAVTRDGHAVPRTMLIEAPTAPGRHTVTLYLLPREEDAQGPDADEALGEAVCFERRDPESVRRARAIVQERLGLTAAPALCDAPSTGASAAVRWIVTALRRAGRGGRGWVTGEASDG
jgi:hypothetical protein